MTWKTTPLDSFEEIPDPQEEQRQIQEIADLMVKLLKKRYPEPNQILRGVHPKSHGCLTARFKVLEGIDKEYQVGLFATPGASYDAVVRYSNADTLVRHDLGDPDNKANGSRGMAVKIQAVDRKVLNRDDGNSSQDFLMINTPQFAFANVFDYLKLQRILFQQADAGQTESAVPFFAPLQSPPPSDPSDLAEFLRVKSTFDVVSLIKKTPVANPLEVPYFGAAPFLFGEGRVMRVSVVPQGPPKPQVVPADASKDYLREALQATMQGDTDVVLDFKIQVRNGGEDDLHIEDATQFWPDDQFPWHNVGRLTISAPQTGLDTPEYLQQCERRFFTPWHSLVEHQPIGGINRLRKAIYDASAEFRRAPQTPE